MTVSATQTSSPRAEQIFAEQLASQRTRTTRMFAWLMLAQWAAAVLAAVIISPRTWIGDQHRIHQHVWIAILAGGALAALPIALAFTYPERRLTRHVIAVAQMLFSALLIHLTGGRVETHFHVFGSLAFMAFYREWQVLLTATVVVAADHMVRGIFVPLSVFGVAIESPWRWVEHAGWVVFEDVILVFSCVRGLSELRGIAERQACLEEANATTEREVAERTKELTLANRSLEENQLALRATNEELRSTVAEREALHHQLMAASREAGMAEVAIGVLHNVGNVLNSVNVAATVLSQKLRASEVPNLVRASAMLREHSGDLPEFLNADDRGKHLPAFLVEVAHCLDEENKCALRELEAVTQGVEHVKQVIKLQQAHAKRQTLMDTVKPQELVETALQMQGASSTRDVVMDRRFEPMAPARLDRHQVLQILVNLISNAMHATRDCPLGTARITLAVAEQRDGQSRRIRFEVQDNGVGISKENLSRVFTHGFTTRTDGHGFGLHTAATAAQSMGGSLRVSSEGPGQGAKFVLILPAAESHNAPETIASRPTGTNGKLEEAACTGS